MALGTKLNFQSRVAGSPVEYNVGVTCNVAPGLHKDAAGILNQPMVADLKYLFTIGDVSNIATADIPSAADLASQEYYTFLRSHNVSLSAYTKNDLFLRTIAIAELYALREELVRDFKCMYKQDFTNLAFPTLLGNVNRTLGSGGITSDLSNIAGRLNLAARDLEKIPMIKGIKIFDDLLLISSELFGDDNITKSGIIIFHKSQILILDTSATSPTVGNLIYTSLAGMSFQAKLALLENTIVNYTNDQDFNNICAEILKATTSKGGTLEAYPLTRLPENLEDCANSIKINFDWLIYDRLSNATVYPIQQRFATTHVNGIGENSNGIIMYRINTVTNRAEGMMYADTYDGTSTYSNQMFRPYYRNSLIFCHSDNPSEEAVTQFIANHEHISAMNDASPRIFSGLSLFHIEYIDLHMINGAAGYNKTYTRFTTLPHTSTLSNWNVNANPQNAKDDLRFIQEYNSFGCLPNIHRLVYNSSSSYSGYYEISYDVRDIDNFATLSNDILLTEKANFNRGAFSLYDKESNYEKFGKSQRNKGKGKDKGDFKDKEKDPKSEEK